MPQPHSAVSATGLPPVPVAVLLSPPEHRHAVDMAGGLPDWCGVTPRDAAGLIARYSQPGDVVIELDAHPTITRAARHLGRRPTTRSAHGDALAAPPAGGTPGIGLILAALPRAGTSCLDLPGSSAAMRAWRTELRAGGYLLTALVPSAAGLGVQCCPASYRATVIAAARDAGLTWQQEFLVVTTPLPADEPRAMPDTAIAVPTVLVDGRHLSAHIKVLAFRNETGEADA